jgi:hypothetical protein
MREGEKMTYLSIFAGRRRYLNVLMVYVHRLLDQRIVDRCHIWNYARLAVDSEYVRTLAAKRGVEVIPMPESDKAAVFPDKWKGYYRFYAALLQPGDLLVKCDDDIVRAHHHSHLPLFARATSVQEAGRLSEPARRRSSSAICPRFSAWLAVIPMARTSSTTHRSSTTTLRHPSRRPTD